jgi:hypothetical protein
MTCFRFGIRDLLWAMVVVGLAVGWWVEHRKLQTRQNWWADHVNQYHSGSITEYKRLMERENPPWHRD